MPKLGAISIPHLPTSSSGRRLSRRAMAGSKSETTPFPTRSTGQPLSAPIQENSVSPSSPPSPWSRAGPSAATRSRPNDDPTSPRALSRLPPSPTPYEATGPSKTSYTGFSTPLSRRISHACALATAPKIWLSCATSPSIWSAKPTISDPSSDAANGPHTIRNTCSKSSARCVVNLDSLPCIYAYVTLMADSEPSPELRQELVAWVRKEIGPIAAPDVIQFAPGLPKTRSGKIMRRILRKIAENEFGALGDTSTLADPAVVEDLIKNR